MGPDRLIVSQKDYQANKGQMERVSESESQKVILDL